MKSFPDNVVLYKTTPEINEETVPPGWMRPHKTNGPIWGKIVVLEGTLQYLISGPEAQVITLDEAVCGVIEPGVLHSVKPVGKVRFRVEFYRTEADAQSRQPMGGDHEMCECDECGESGGNSGTKNIVLAAMVLVAVAGAGLWYWAAS